MIKMEERTFRVTRPFKYAGERFERGDIWSPTGAMWDTKLIEDAKKLVEITPELIDFKVDTRQKLYDNRQKSIKGEVFVLYKAFGKSAAKVLEGAGFKTVKQVKEAKDEDLLALNGIGQKRLDAIRAVA